MKKWFSRGVQVNRSDRGPAGGHEKGYVAFVCYGHNEKNKRLAPEHWDATKLMLMAPRLQDEDAVDVPWVSWILNVSPCGVLQEFLTRWRTAGVFGVWNRRLRLLGSLPDTRPLSAVSVQQLLLPSLRCTHDPVRARSHSLTPTVL